MPTNIIATYDGKALKTIYSWKTILLRKRRQLYCNLR